MGKDSEQGRRHWYYHHSLYGIGRSKDNEATIEWLIWALLNKRRFGVELPADKLDKAVHTY